MRMSKPDVAVKEHLVLIRYAAFRTKRQFLIVNLLTEMSGCGVQKKNDILGFWGIQ